MCSFSGKVLTLSAELLNLVRHMQAYPSDPLEAALRNVFDFDVYKPETISMLADILDRNGYEHCSDHPFAAPHPTLPG